MFEAPPRMNPKAHAPSNVGVLLRAPGFGLLTVSTGAGAALSFFQKYFRAQVPEQWPKQAAAVLGSARDNARPVLLGIPSDSGGGICRGAAHGPLHLRMALYARDRSWKDRELGDVPCIPQLVHDSMLNERQLEASGRSLWGDAYRPGLPVSPLNLAEELLTHAWSSSPRFRPLVLGGDHSVAGPIFAALARAGRLDRLAVLHIDAHTDLLESRYGIDHCFGTWTSHAVKRLADPGCWVQIGIRASGRAKQHWESAYGLRQFWSAELRRKDPKKFADALIDHWKQRGCTQLYVTHDIDATDGAQVPSTGTPEPNGLDPRWLKVVLQRVSRALPLVGSDMVEVAPVLGSSSAARKTIKIAVDYIEALTWL